MKWQMVTGSLSLGLPQFCYFIPFVSPTPLNSSYYLCASKPNYPDIFLDPDPIDESPPYHVSPETSCALNYFSASLDSLSSVLSPFTSPGLPKCSFTVAKYICYSHPLWSSSILCSSVPSIYQSFFFPAIFTFHSIPTLPDSLRSASIYATKHNSVAPTLNPGLDTASLQTPPHYYSPSSLPTSIFFLHLILLLLLHSLITYSIPTTTFFLPFSLCKWEVFNSLIHDHSSLL